MGTEFSVSATFPVRQLSGLMGKVLSIVHRTKAPTAEELGALVHRISQRVAKFLERRDFLARDEENSYLTLETSDDEAMQQLYGPSVLPSDPTKAARYLRYKAYHR